MAPVKLPKRAPSGDTQGLALQRAGGGELEEQGLLDRGGLVPVWIFCPPKEGHLKGDI